MSGQAPDALIDNNRENWGSRAGFVLAAVGSAVGLGNLWGFPYKVYDNGGGAFLIPYLLAMVLLGVPLLILEFSLGHMTQRAAPDAFRGINRKTEPVGWWGILLGFIIITYYPVILAWCAAYLWFCIQGIFNGGVLPWAGEGMDGVKNATDFFFENFLQRWQTSDNVAPWTLGHLVTPITICLAIVWVAMYLCIFRGVKFVSKVVLWTVPLPWIMLMILTIRGLTLPGAAEGLNFFLDPNWELLAEPETWRWAFGQMFFSMSLAFGVMITYSSFLHRKSDINNNAAIIGLADVGTSFVAGIAIFATLGAMAFATKVAGQPVGVDKVVDQGVGLAFVAFPHALSQLPGAPWFGAIFFIALLTLGIDSAFSITESVLASLVDKTGWKRSWTLIGMSVVGLGSGLIFCTRGGLAWIGAVDGFVNGPIGGITLLGLLEAVVIGWAYRLGRLRKHANERSDWNLGLWWEWIIRYFAPIVLSALFAWSLMDAVSKPGGMILDTEGNIVLPSLVTVMIAALVPLLALVLSSIPSPGADRYATHIGKPRTGRFAGIVGTGIVVAALGCLIVAFVLTSGMIVDGSVKDDQWILPGSLAAVAVVLSLVGGAFGAVVVHRAEKTQKRPSGIARAAAGFGVMLLGATFGTLLSLAVHVTQSFGTSKNDVDDAAEKIQRAHELTGASYAVLAVMVGILVIGLGWCFYRAIKAVGAGVPEAEQISEGLDEE